MLKIYNIDHKNEIKLNIDGPNSKESRIQILGYIQRRASNKDINHRFEIAAVCRPLSAPPGAVNL